MSELFAGLLTRIAPDGSRDSLELPFPAGVVSLGDGSLAVAIWSVSDEDGGSLGPDFSLPPGAVVRVTGF